LLVQEEWILTAAHVAFATDSYLDSITIANQQYSIKQIILHPQWQNADVIEGVKNDIALIQLNQPATDVAPLTLYSNNDEAGKDVIFVGWGDVGNGLTGVEGADGRFRIATNRIEKVDKQWLIFCFDEPPETTKIEGISSTQCSEEEYNQQENWQERE